LAAGVDDVGPLKSLMRDYEVALRSCNTSWMGSNLPENVATPSINLCSSSPKRDVSVQIIEAKKVTPQTGTVRFKQSIQYYDESQTTDNGTYEAIMEDRGGWRIRKFKEM